MQISIQQRTRTLTNGVYSAWSAWATTTELPPYVNTDLTEYRLDNTVEFKPKYDANFSSILALTIADGTPYKATVDFLTAQFDNYNISDEYKAQLQAQMMSNMTVGFTTSAMQTAISLTDKEVMADANYDNTIKQGDILDKQATKLTADTSLVGAQEAAITQQVVDNRKIKVFAGLLDSYGTNGAGGLSVSTDMWKYVFDLAANLTTQTAPTQSTLTVAKV